MRRAALFLGVCCWVMAGCSDDFEEGYEPVGKEVVVTLSASNILHIDRSLVFFFRKYTGGDSLFYQTEVEGPTEESTTLKFELPAGYYQMVLIGNGEENHIRSKGKSYTDMYLDYADGTEPPELYYSARVINVGDMKITTSGVIPATVQVTLQVRQIPFQVNKIEVDLKNTGAGLYFNFEFLNIPTEPCITKSLFPVVAGSSPEVHFNSFLTAPSGARSFLEVRCYDAENRPVYRGTSETFKMGGTENISISCTFDTKAALFRDKDRQKAGSREKGIPNFYLVPENGH